MARAACSSHDAGTSEWYQATEPFLPSCVSKTPMRIMNVLLFACASGMGDDFEPKHVVQACFSLHVDASS